jgi:hypothetical protein
MLGHPTPAISYVAFEELMTEHIKYLEINAQSQDGIVKELKRSQKTSTEMQSLRLLDRLRKLARERGMSCAVLCCVHNSLV